MAAILRDLPFFDVKTTAVVHGRPVPIKADQIIVWVGITEGRHSEFDSRRPFFPAILDTGHSHDFSIQVSHLIHWAGLDPRFLKKSGETRIHGDRLQLLEAGVWIRLNQPGQRDRFLDLDPFPLELDWGIAVYPTTMTRAPRLPLLGLRALRRAQLHLTIDGRRQRVRLRTARRLWFFLASHRSSGLVVAGGGTVRSRPSVRFGGMAPASSGILGSS